MNTKNRMKSKEELPIDRESPQDITEHFWPIHLSGDELESKYPQGTNATITKVVEEQIHDQQRNVDIPKAVVYFKEFKRGLIVNKTNGRLLLVLLGQPTEWTGETVFLRSAKRSNGKKGIDVGKRMKNG